MKRYCLNQKCSEYKKNSSNGENIVKNGFYKRAGDSKKIQRFQCNICKKNFSSSTNTLEYNQFKRRENPMIFKLLSSCVSMRRCAILLGVSRGTIARRLVYFGKKSRMDNQKFNLNLKLKENKVTHMQIDDLITIDHTKLKPVSVSVAVDAENRYILGAKVSTLRSFGHLAQKGQAKYPERKNTHKQGLQSLFEEIKNVVDEKVLIRSDEHNLYPIFIKRYFPNSTHESFKSIKGCVVGQGELKKVKWDPLFCINHTLAMLRANINRLVRKSWCTTKRIARLQDHLDLFINYYNREILKNISLIHRE